jgi:spermidine synthase
MRVRLVVAVFLSGAASLVYEVCWTRRLADITSATATAQAVVLAIFFFGLGVGATWPGRRAATSKRPLLGYALLEAGALSTALISIVAFGVFDGARAAVARWGASPATALGCEIVLAGAFLLVPTTLLGASLPFLIEHADRAPSKHPLRGFVGITYAVNTLGAAAGCAFAGFISIERYGLARTIAVGASLSLGAAAIAALTSREPAKPRDVATAADSPPPSTEPFPRAFLAAAALGGLIGVGIEVIWTRLFAILVLNTVYAFTEVLVAVLVGVAAGAWLAHRIVARVGLDSRRILRVTAFAQIAAALAIALVPVACLFASDVRGLEARLAAGTSIAGALALIATLAIPVALNASTLPLLALAARAKASRSFGHVYSANTVGSVAGSLCAGFILLPRLGAEGGSAVLESASLLLAFVLLRLSSEKKTEPFAALIPGVVLAGVHFLFHGVSYQIMHSRLSAGTKILELREGVASDVMVTESMLGARPTGQRRIWINSSWVAGTGGGHRALGHLPALFVPAPRRAVGIALGTGQTFAALFDNGLTDLDIVEINSDVIDLSRRWFAEANRGLFERRGVVVHHDDGRAFLRAATSRYDVIVLEPLQAWSVGTSSLYAREFYEEARRTLSDDGVLAQWIPFYGQGVAETRAMVRTALEVFPDVSLWLDGRDGILLARRSRTPTSIASLDARIAQRKLGDELTEGAVHGGVDILSLLVLGPEGIARWAHDAALITDDRPFLEFVAAREIGADSFVEILRSIAAARDPSRPATVDVAGQDPGALEADAASRALVDDSIHAPGDFDGRAAALEDAMKKSPAVSLLRKRYRDVVDAWAVHTMKSGGTTMAVEAILRRAIEHDDDFGEAMLNLAILLSSHNDLAGARDYVERASHVERVRKEADALRTKLDARATPPPR